MDYGLSVPKDRKTKSKVYYWFAIFSLIFGLSGVLYILLMIFELVVAPNTVVLELILLGCGGIGFGCFNLMTHGSGRVLAVIGLTGGVLVFLSIIFFLISFSQSNFPNFSGY